MVIKIDNCEECGEPIQRAGTQLWCVNGCFEDDTRNYFSEDEMEAGQTGGVIFPPDLNEESAIHVPKYSPCDHCGGEDCCCCSYGKGY